jgi:hypothetical protein
VGAFLGDKFRLTTTGIVVRIHGVDGVAFNPAGMSPFPRLESILIKYLEMLL